MTAAVNIVWHSDAAGLEWTRAFARPEDAEALYRASVREVVGDKSPEIDDVDALPWDEVERLYEEITDGDAYGRYDYGWDTLEVEGTAMQPDLNVGDVVDVPDPEPGDLWAHAFTGRIVAVSGDTATVVDQQDDAWDVDVDRLRLEEDDEPH